MTAIVVSFPQERVFRTRPEQTEMREACRAVRRHFPKLDAASVWDRAVSGLWLKRSMERARSNAITDAAESSEICDRLSAALAIVEAKNKEKFDGIARSVGLRPRGDQGGYVRDEPPPGAA